MKTKEITPEEVGQQVMLSWRRLNKSPTPEEIAKIEWRIKKIEYSVRHQQRAGK